MEPEQQEARKMIFKPETLLESDSYKRWVSTDRIYVIAWYLYHTDPYGTRKLPRFVAYKNSDLFRGSQSLSSYTAAVELCNKDAKNSL